MEQNPSACLAKAKYKYAKGKYKYAKAKLFFAKAYLKNALKYFPKQELHSGSSSQIIDFQEV